MSKRMQKKDILDFIIPPEVAFGALIVMIVFPFPTESSAAITNTIPGPS